MGLLQTVGNVGDVGALWLSTHSANVHGGDWSETEILVLHTRAEARIRLVNDGLGKNETGGFELLHQPQVGTSGPIDSRVGSHFSRFRRRLDDTFRIAAHHLKSLAQLRHDAPTASLSV